jgi:hypothetical protein
MAITGTNTPYLQANPGIAPYSQRTIACWVKMSPTATGTNLFFALTGTSFGWQFNLHYAGNPPNVFGAVAQSNNGSTIDGSGASGISNVPWHFILATFDNGGVPGNVQTVRIYYDGVLSTATTTGGPVTALLDNDSVSNDYIWAGSADGGAVVAYPMVWKRLLSQSEITALAAQGDPRIVAPASLVSFVQLNQGAGTIPDLVGPGMNWVVTGGTFTVVADPFGLNIATAPGTPVPATTTIDTIFSSLYPTRSANLASGVSYRWSDPTTVQGLWPDGTMMLAHFEARPIGGSVAS